MELVMEKIQICFNGTVGNVINDMLCSTSMYVDYVKSMHRYYERERTIYFILPTNKIVVIIDRSS